MPTPPSTRPPADESTPSVRLLTDEGELLPASATPRSPRAIREAVLASVAHHVRSVAVWREGAEGSWRLGDYAYYVVSFSPMPSVELYVQLWSEPEQPVLIEVSSGYLNDAVRACLNDDLRERIRDRGFSVGGTARNYQKRIAVEGATEAEALAREVLDLLVSALGYDARAPLRFQRCLDTRAKSNLVYDSLSRPMLITLLRRCGYVLEPEAAYSDRS